MLSEQKQAILSLAPGEALDRILAAPSPAELVQSFSDQDFFHLVQEIGPEDAMTLLAQASGKQWQYVLDAAIWEGDRIDLDALTRWIRLYQLTDSERTMHWLTGDQRELTEFYLFKNLEVVVRENDQDPGEIGERFFTLDDTFYIRILDDPDPESSGDIAEEDRKEAIRKLLTDCAATDYFAYQKLLLESVSILPAETEEELYRLRNVRLAEKGFLPFEEALGVYQPLASEALVEHGSRKVLKPDPDAEPFLPAPLFPVHAMEGENLFSRALTHIASDAVLIQLQEEFAALCNQIIVADQKKIEAPAHLRESVQKAGGYLSIGLELLCRKSDHPGPQRAAGLIQRFLLSDIFRVGFGRALELKWRAERWRREAWFERTGLPLSFWGEQWLGVLGGLLIKKPLFYDNFQTGRLYREFAAIQDIQITEAILNEIMAFDDLLSRMPPALEPRFRQLTYKNMLLTSWARSHLGLPETPSPLGLDPFRRFFDDLFSKSEPVDIQHPRKTTPEMKATFLYWLSNQSRLSPEDIGRRLGVTLERLFREIEAELGGVPRNDLDPRYIHLFVLQR